MVSCHILYAFLQQIHCIDSPLDEPGIRKAGVEEPLLGRGRTCALYFSDGGGAGLYMVPELLESAGVPVLSENKYFCKYRVLRNDCILVIKLPITACLRFTSLTQIPLTLHKRAGRYMRMPALEIYPLMGGSQETFNLTLLLNIS